MKENKVRYIVIAVLFVLLSAGIIVGAESGTICGFGIDSIAVLCPVGALLTMIASRTLVPRVVISFVLALVAIFLLGRAFCGWLCPVSLWERIRQFFAPKKKVAEAFRNAEEANRAIGQAEIDRSMAEIKAAMKEACGGEGCTSCASTSCAAKRKALDSRHAVLGGAILSTAIFGFPVFCLVCPIGLTFATIFLVIGLFGAADVTWTVVFVPVLLLAEVVFFRKWCTHICPVSALMSLVSKGNRTFVPAVDQSKCLECGSCAAQCPAEAIVNE